MRKKEWFEKWRPPEITHGVPTKWGWVVLHPENLKLGRYVDIGFATLIHAGAGVEIGDYVQIGGGCKIYSVNTIDGTEGKIIIKRNAKIGANSVILPNVTIGENAIVGALSLVKKDIPPNEVWAGVPAKKLRKLMADGRRKVNSPTKGSLRLLKNEAM